MSSSILSSTGIFEVNCPFSVSHEAVEAVERNTVEGDRETVEEDVERNTGRRVGGRCCRMCQYSIVVTFYGKHRFFLTVCDHRSFQYQFNLEEGVVRNKPLFGRNFSRGTR